MTILDYKQAAADWAAAYLRQPSAKRLGMFEYYAAMAHKSAEAQNIRTALRKRYKS